MKNDLREQLFSEENIFLALFSVNSYVLNKELLSKKDKEALEKLNDIFDEENICYWVREVKKKLKGIIDGKKYLQAKVYFKPKKYDEETGAVEFRPLHHATLLDQITAVAMLNILIYDFDDGKIGMSNLSRLIPHNFYGNRVAYDVEHLFIPWEAQYKKYNKKANDSYKKYHESKEYKWEIDLDLEQFFPSVNSVALYNYICEMLPVNYSEENRKLIMKIIEKLIFIEINSLEDDDRFRYQGEDNDYDWKFAKGIPQGLPHSYFLANLLMIEIEKIYRNTFRNGEMYFYVDDSVIFTNDVENKDDLQVKIDVINSSIDKWLQEKQNSVDGELDPKLVKYINDRKECYKVKIHDVGEKSTISDISKANESEVFLNYIGRETSKTAFEMNTNSSDEESYVLLHKTEELCRAVERESDDVDKCLDDTNDLEEKIRLESYKKKLIRYKKFFKYRKVELMIRMDRVDEDIIDGFIDSLRDISSNSDLKTFFDLFSEDIFCPLLALTFRERYNLKKYDEVDEIFSLLEQINILLFGRENKDSSYIYKAYEAYHKRELHRTSKDYKYVSLISKVEENAEYYQKKSDAVRYKDMQCEIEKAAEDNWLNEKMSDHYAEMASLVDNNTPSLRRMLLNAFVSGILGFEISDDVVLHKKTNRNITYTELRLLEMLRSRHIDLTLFFSLSKDIFKEEYNCSIDYSIFQVLGYFKIYVSEIDKIDNLILIHKYTCDIWKNGAKHLYFYTLHNQEHAVDLVQNAVKLVRAIDYIELKRFDYYILFIACYLHDISMVTFPFLDAIQEDTYASNLIYSDFVDEIRKSLEETNLSDVSVKKILRDYYLKVDEFYEALVRNNHAKNSASEIRSRNELSFIDAALREIVAEVSEAHGYNVADVYGKKSIAKDQMWSEKYTKIMLRLADLLDMSNYRVSEVILNHNVNNMGKVSRFHWLSHLVTKGYTLDVEYKLRESVNSDYLKKGNINEIIILNVMVDLPQFSKESSSGCMEMCLNGVNDGNVELEIGKKCNSKECNFLCKWFSKKNNWLFTELDALKKYLNSVPNNFYNTDIKVIVQSSGHNILSPEQFSYLKQGVEG